MGARWATFTAVVMRKADGCWVTERACWEHHKRGNGLSKDSKGDEDGFDPICSVLSVIADKCSFPRPVTTNDDKQARNSKENGTESTDTQSHGKMHHQISLKRNF